MAIAILALALLTAMQVGVVLLLHHGSAHPQRAQVCLVVATLLGFASCGAMMVIFSHMNANLGSGLAVGATFVGGQFSLAVATRIRLSARRWLGVAVMLVGLFLLAFCTPSGA